VVISDRNWVGREDAVQILMTCLEGVVLGL
jgi:hypothetical protein